MKLKPADRRFVIIAARKHNYVPDAPAAKWNKNLKSSIPPQVRKGSFHRHLAAIAFRSLSAGSDYVFTRGYPM
ncbi:MAG: hypothetical protein IKW49_09185 [Opitutales bacterium]|nr:hypothetical protein [Opitutales bacterium]